MGWAERHHISFNIAKKVFNDEKRIEIYDMQHSIEEDRYNTIGMVEDILFVVYTERTDKIRLISARLATEMEDPRNGKSLSAGSKKQKQIKGIEIYALPNLIPPLSTHLPFAHLCPALTPMM